MQNIQATLIAALVLGGTATTGCGGGTTDGSPVGTSQARLVMAVHGNGAASLHVTASDDASGEAVVDRTVAVEANGTAMLDLALGPSSYTFHVDVIGGPSGVAHLCDGSAQAVLQDGETTEIQVSANVGGNGGPANVHIGVDTVPRINGIQVEMAADGTVQIHVDAADADGDPLSFLWSGAGIQGTVTGSATLSLSATALVTFVKPHLIHLIVQDVLGAATAVDVPVPSTNGSSGGTSTTSPGSNGSTTNSGGVTCTTTTSNGWPMTTCTPTTSQGSSGGTPTTSQGSNGSTANSGGVTCTPNTNGGITCTPTGQGSLSAAQQACLEALDSCTASCHTGGALADALCLSNCSVALATCLAN